MDEINNMPKKSSGNPLPFKNILSSLMKERRLTVKEVAALANVAPSVVQNWIEGKTPYDLYAVDRLSQKLGVPFKKLLLGVSETIDAPTAISDLFDATDFFDGLARIKIERLTPKKQKE